MRGRQLYNVGRCVVAINSATKMSNVSWHVSDRKTTQSSIKAGMSGNLNLCYFVITPEDVARCKQNIAKEDTFSRIWTQFGGTMPWRLHPT